MPRPQGPAAPARRSGGLRFPATGRAGEGAPRPSPRPGRTILGLQRWRWRCRPARPRPTPRSADGCQLRESIRRDRGAGLSQLREQFSDTQLRGSHPGGAPSSKPVVLHRAAPPRSHLPARPRLPGPVTQPRLLEPSPPGALRASAPTAPQFPSREPTEALGPRGCPEDRPVGLPQPACRWGAPPRALSGKCLSKPGSGEN